jgi:hypothetical protein
MTLSKHSKANGVEDPARDITAGVRAEQLLRLEHAVTGSLAEADSVSAALTEVIRAICATEGWECGRYFRVDDEAGVLRFAESWGVPEPSIQQFLERSNQRSHEIVYKPGVGLMGVVWQSGQPLWVADVTKDDRALRAAFTVDVALCGAFCISGQTGKDNRRPCFQQPVKSARRKSACRRRYRRSAAR